MDQTLRASFQVVVTREAWAHHGGLGGRRLRSWTDLQRRRGTRPRGWGHPRQRVDDFGTLVEAEHLADLPVGVFDPYVEHEEVVGEVAHEFGSTAFAWQGGLPVISIPTTYAGSEMTPIWDLTGNGRRRTGRCPSVPPRSGVRDPELTLHLPSDISVTSGRGRRRLFTTSKRCWRCRRA
ncbi:maleylacetate reductase [Streptomyces sp. LBUM 1479]|nr:maleylacetate reductase [Streptomyces sp. LBUM 1485]MBP5912870.1 maleylacetate reductase [Streptomyces sp. LBUM 1486]MBP5933055.1 maleylacetate reductase [Streptomyces sp. LBUM 1479]QTU57693.1 maleylacetate reductase [Streptomyces sp. LBUM 1480]